jgi:transcriptional regulator with GAF, ATPase, and Fis domain
VKSELPILITGETGTGKELVAAAIHQLDPKRRCGPFVPVNCAALLATVAESELFGHRRGAFTGADRDRNGLFRAAKGGILFLDEIGELDLALQGKLLRAIQEKRIVPVGEEREIAVDVRVVAATNRDLAERVQEGKFRLDLFHRLDVGLVHIPPLRERRADFRPLIQFFLEKHSELNGKKFSIGPDFLGALRQLRWPGNVRQLENLVRKVLLEKTSRTPLQLCDLPVAVLQELSRGLPASPLPIESARDRPESENHKAAPPEIEIRWAHLLHTQDNLAGCLESCDRAVVAIALERAHGNQTEAARILGRTGRTIYNKVRKHSLHHLVGKGQNVAA